MTAMSDKRGADEKTDLQIKLKYSQSEKDDWTKIQDKALRKKIQNRLAKRKSRTLHCQAISVLRTDDPVRNKGIKG